MKRLAAVFVSMVLGLMLAVPALAADYDVVILKGRVMDPETMHDDIANVGIKDGRIAAITKPLDWQTGDTFESSIYQSCNLMWSLQPYFTMGFEYQYGKRKNVDDSDLDNHRFAFGIQIF